MKVAVAAIIIHKNKVLIGKKVVREGHFVSGGWHLPGGHVIDCETVEDALLREIKEETDLTVNIKNKLTFGLVEATETVVHWYVCEPVTLQVTAKDDLAEAKFVPMKKVVQMCDKRATSLWPEEVINFLCKNR